MELKIYLEDMYQKQEYNRGPSGSVQNVGNTFNLYLSSQEDEKVRTRVFVALPPLPSYMVVESAILNITRQGGAVYWTWVDGGVNVHRILTSWTDESLKTSNPEFKPLPESSISDIDSGLKTFDITGYIQDLVGVEENHGILIKKPTEEVSWKGYIHENYFGPTNEDETRRPYILIEYTKRAPRPPKNLTPTAETRYNDAIIRFEWEHDATLEDVQSRFDLNWRKEGGSWQNISQITSNQHYDMPANTLPVGTVYWRVRTYGENGLVSNWTESSFLCAGKSATPTITAPPGQVNTSQPIVEWTSESQIYYQVQVLNLNNSVYWDSGEVLSATTAVQIAEPLQNESQYAIRVRTKNQFNIWTDWASKLIDVNFGRPAEPSIKLIPENANACMRIQITNPAEVDFRDNEVYRRIPGGVWQKTAKAIPANGVIYDWTLDGNTEFEYKVRAFNTESGFTDSPSRYSSIILRYGVIGSATTPENFVWLKHNVERQGLYGRERALNRYAGRTKPVPVFGEQRTKDINMRVAFRTQEELNKFIALCDSGDILLYRDHRGKKMYCSIGDIPTEEKKHQLTAGFALTEVDYKEGV